MSGAFVKEDDEGFDDLPERAISAAANWVTSEGLAAIEAEITRLNGELPNVGDNR